MKTLFLLVFLCCLTSCAIPPSVNTQLVSTVGEKFRSHYQIKKLAVLAPKLNLKDQLILAKSFKRALRDYDVDVLEPFELLPLQKKYSGRRLYRMLATKKVDTVLVFDVKTQDFIETYVPPVFMPGYSYTNISGRAMITTESPSYVIGDYTIYKPFMDVYLNLKNVKNSEESIWISEALSGGDTSTAFSDLIVDIVKKTVLSFEKEGFIVRNVKTESEVKEL